MNLSNLPITTATILKWLMKRGHRLERLDGTGVMVSTYKNKSHYFVDGFTSLLPYGLGVVLANKYFVREMLKRSEVGVSKGKLFGVMEKRKALGYALNLGWPVLIRTENANNSAQSILDLRTDEAFLKGFTQLKKFGESLLVEEMFSGKKLRVFIDKNGYFQALYKTKKPGKNMQVVTRSMLEEKFVKQSSKRDWSYVVGDHKSKTRSCLALGSWYYEDVTDRVDSSLRGLALRVVNAFPKMPFISFEVIIRDGYTLPVDKKNYVVTEAYHSAGLHIFGMMRGSSDQRYGLEVVGNYFMDES